MDIESEFVQHEPCPKCGSDDNLARYTDGHAHCFGCAHYEPATGQPVKERKPVSKGDFEPIAGEYSDLVARKIKEETCRKFGYRVNSDKGVHLAPYFKDGQLVGQKVRPKNKKKMWLNGTMPSLFGQNLWDGGRKLVVTEGEIDALSVSQVQRNKWPVVSVPNGADGAYKSLAKQLDWLAGFDEIILMFDMDDAGRKAAAHCATLFEPGHCKIAELPHKDANECLIQGDGEAIIQAMWNAKSFKPNGSVSISDILEEALAPVEWGISWPWPRLTNLTYGRREGELYLLGAGTGIGKTDVFTQIIAHTLHDLKLPCAIAFLEQLPRETVRRIAGKVKGQRFHVPDAGWTPDDYKAALLELRDQDNLYMYDSWGVTEWEPLKSFIRHHAKADGVKDFFIDHLTAMADPGDGERASLEVLMRDVASLATELRIRIYMISHLNTPDGKPHEEGGRVQIRNFKGSRSIGFWSHFMFGLERDQQCEDEDERHITTFRVLKDRYTGQATGQTFELHYDEATGMLEEGGGDEPDMFTDKTASADDDIPF